MRISRKYGKAAGFLAVFVLTNVLMTFLLTPFSSPSTEMWDGYYEMADASIEVIWVGTSQCYESINPEITDPIMACVSYNMGTNAQSLMDSGRALEQALGDHAVKEVVLVLDYDCLMKGKDRYARPEASFIYAMNRHLPLGERIRNIGRFVTDPEYLTASQSLNFFFPWLNNRSNMHFEYMLQNAWAKLTGKEPEPDDLNNVRNASGYKGFRREINYDTAEAQTKTSWKASKVSEDALRTAGEICTLCKEKGATLHVLVTPVPISAVLCYGEDYFTRLEYVRDLFAGYDVDFYDFNLARPELFARDPSYFKDWIHLNHKGASAFSAAVARFYRMPEEERAELFYAPEDFLSSIREIDSTYLKLSSVPGEGIQGTAYAYTGPEVPVEFEIQVCRESGQTYETIREYDTETDFHFTPEYAGTWYFRVNARRVGSEAAYERCYSTSAEYWMK